MTREEITQAGKEYARQYTKNQGQHFADFVAGADCVQAQTESRWISVKDSLPQDGQLIVYSYKMFSLLRIYGATYYPLRPSNKTDYWMPLEKIKEDER